MLRETFEALLVDILAACRSHYGDRLVSLVVFGSVARQTPRPDSDIDLMLVVDDLPDGRMPRVREFAKIEEAVEPGLQSAKGGGVHTRLSPVFKSRDELEFGTPLLLDMVDDARILFDRNAVFAQRLERLRHRMKELGSKKVRKGGGYYWVVKPGARPGDVIEL
jgi:hypothetical protein